MVALVIAFPAMVMHYKGAASTVDPNKVKIEIPQIELPPLDFSAAAESQIAASIGNKNGPGAAGSGAALRWRRRLSSARCGGP